MSDDELNAQRSAEPGAYAMQRFRCPKIKAKLSFGECAKRHVRRTLSRWFGKETDAMSTPLDRVCQTCELGRLRHLRIAREAEELRRKTGCKPPVCARALVEVSGNFASAIAWLRSNTPKRRPPTVP